MQISAKANTTKLPRTELPSVLPYKKDCRTFYPCYKRKELQHPGGDLHNQVSMTELIEGEWKNFVFKMAKPEDFPKVLKHMRENFYVDEPLNKIINYDEEDYKVLDKVILEVLNEGISFVALDNTSGVVAGVRISSIELKKDENPEREPLRPKMKIVVGFLNSCTEGEGDIFKRFPDIDKYAHLFMASVGSNYRGQGLATEMYRRSLNFFKAQGILVAKSIFTSPFTRKAAVNLGFVELKSVRFLDYKDPHGLPYLSTAQENDVGSCMAIRII